MSELNIDSLNEYRTEFLDSNRNHAIQEAVMKNGIKKSITNQTVIDSQPFIFSVDVDSDKVLDQKQSGRCWMFAALNFIRQHIEKEHHIKNMQLSPAYNFFYDKMEKSNYFYQNIINTADKPLSDRKVNWLLSTPQQDGGDWNLVISLVKKYGVVPKEFMDEDAVSANTTELNFMLNRKLQKDAMKLRDLVNSGASQEKINATLHRMNEENYRIISISLGNPPKEFTYEYRDENNNYHTTGSVTPVEFYNKFVSIDPDDYVEIMNLPGEDYPFYQSYGIELSDNMVGGAPNRYVNLPMSELNDLMIKQLKDDDPVWFGCDVLQEGYGEPQGLLDLDVYDWKRAFGVTLGNDKTKRFEYKESLPTHAMLICGVDLKDEKPIRWKIQNTWGAKVGHNGYFMMTNDWNNEYTYEIVINKKFLSDKQMKAYNKEPIILPYWNAMNPI